MLGGQRALGVNVGQSTHGVLTNRVETLTNDFFVNLLETSFAATWQAFADGDGVFEALDAETGEARWTATRVDLIFGSNAQFRALCEVYASDDAGSAFMEAFVAAWGKVMISIGSIWPETPGQAPQRYSRGLPDAAVGRARQSVI